MISTIRKKVSINESLGVITVKQKDSSSRYIEVSLVDVDDKTPINVCGCSVRVYVETSDSQYVFFNGNVVDGDRGVVSFLIPVGITNNVGFYNAEMCLMCASDNSRLSTYDFKIEVLASLFDDSVVESEEDFSALQTALNTVDNIEQEIATIQSGTRSLLDESAHVKPIFLAEIDGYAAQSIAYIGKNGDGEKLFAIGFSKHNDDNASLIAVFNEDTKAVIASVSANLGHINSLGCDGEYLYSASDSGTSVNKFKIVFANNTMSITTLTPLTFGSGIKVWSVFDYNGNIYAYGVNNNRSCYWQLNTGTPQYTYISSPYLVLPTESPRTNQAWSTDGTYIYWLRSNPNSMAVFDFASGEFIRWEEIGDFVGGSMMIGEIEMACFADGKMKMISQYYYPNGASTAKRFWLFSELLWSKNTPLYQQHWYPNEARIIYVSNANANGIAIRTNLGDNYPKNEQTGAQNYPYPSLETALYAAMATPSNPIEIIMLDTGTDYEIDDLVLRSPSMSIVITCVGHVTFDFLHLPSGNLTIRGNCSFEQIATTQYSRLQIIDGTFTADGLIQEETEEEETEETAPYSFGGVVGIINGKYTGGSDEEIFEFKPGATGVVGFTEGSPVATSYQQTNLTLLNVRNSGARERWTEIFSGGTVAIGTAITPTISGFYVNNNTVYAVKWRADSNSDFFNTIVHVSGNTIADLSAIINDNGTIKYRMARIRFRPRIQQSGNWIYGNIVIISITDYTVSDGSITSTALNAVPNGFSINSIAVKGY